MRPFSRMRCKLGTLEAASYWTRKVTSSGSSSGRSVFDGFLITNARLSLVVDSPNQFCGEICLRLGVLSDCAFGRFTISTLAALSSPMCSQMPVNSSCVRNETLPVHWPDSSSTFSYSNIPGQGDGRCPLATVNVNAKPAKEARNLQKNAQITRDATVPDDGRRAGIGWNFCGNFDGNDARFQLKEFALLTNRNCS